jgi:hypothetical protein
MSNGCIRQASLCPAGSSEMERKQLKLALPAVQRRASQPPAERVRFQTNPLQDSAEILANPLLCAALRTASRRGLGTRFTPSRTPQKYSQTLSFAQFYAQLRGEGWELDSLPPPLADCKPETRSQTGPFFFLFQRGLAEQSDFRRLALQPKSVSEAPVIPPESKGLHK